MDMQQKVIITWHYPTEHIWVRLRVQNGEAAAVHENYRYY